MRIHLIIVRKEGESMHPFREGDTFAMFTNLVEKVTMEIDSLDNEYVLKVSPIELEQYYVGKVLINPLGLHLDQKYIKNQTVTGVDVSHDFMRDVFAGERAVVPGTRIDIAIPFEGDPMLWRIRASRFSTGGYPEIEIDQDEIVFSVSFPDDSANPDRLRSDVERIVKSLADAVGYLKRDIDNHNNSAPNTIRQALERKRTLANRPSVPWLPSAFLSGGEKPNQHSKFLRNAEKTQPNARQ